MKKYLIYVLLCSCSLLFTATTCVDDQYYSEHYNHVLFTNMSGDSIYFVCDYGESPLNPLNPHYVFEEEPDCKIWELADKGRHDIYISKDYSEYVYLIVFKKCTIDKYTNKELAEQNIYDKMYSLNGDDLEKMNFHIIYTGE